MPSVSSKQHRFMAAAMNNPAFAAEHHIKPGVAAEFVHADRGSPWKRAAGGFLPMKPPPQRHPPNWMIPDPAPDDEQGKSDVDRMEQDIIRSQIDKDKDKKQSQPMADGGALHRDMGGSAFWGPPGAISPFMPTMPDRTNDPWPKPGDPRVGTISAPPSGAAHAATASPSSAAPMANYLAQIYQGMNKTGAGGVSRQPDLNAGSPDMAPDMTGGGEGGGDGMAAGGSIAKAMHAAQEMPRQKFDLGGMSMGEMVPFSARQANREIVHEGGLLQSEVPGRTDHLPLSVAAGSYVIPADVVSGLGEGNTLSGAHVLNHALGVGPFGTQQKHLPVHHTMPAAPHAPAFNPPPMTDKPEKVQYAAGGTVPAHEKNIHGDRQTVPVVVAGGEYVVPPNVVAFHPKLGGGHPEMPPQHKEMALKKGHDTLDAFVKSARAKHVKEISKLPGPAK